MRFNVPKLGLQTPNAGTWNSKKILRAAVQLVVVALIVFGGYVLLHNHNKNKSSGTVVKPRTINQLESDTKKSYQNLLDNSDYTSYQAAKSVLAGLYVDEKDTADAQKVMDEVFAKVPKDKINSQTYLALVKIDAANNDTPKLKEDLKTLISKLRAEGESKSADAEQKYLDGLK